MDSRGIRPLPQKAVSVWKRLYSVGFRVYRSQECDLAPPA
jgi:hypothetical protein